MRIICSSPEDYEIALTLADTARAAGIQADVVPRQNAYALTMWSVEDVGAMKDERAQNMSDADKEKFLEYAAKQLKEDMTERGWDSLDTLLDMFLDE